MRLTFFRPPASNRIAPAKMAIDLDVLRTKILFRILFAFLLITFSLLFASLPERIHQKDWGVIFVFIVIILWMVAVALIRRITYQIKAGSLISVGLLLGLVCLVTDGMFGPGLIFLLATPLITSMLFSAPRSFWVFLIAAVLYAMTVLLMESGILPYPAWSLSHDNPTLDTWVLAGFSLTMAGGALLISLLSVTRGLVASIVNEKRLVKNFDVEHAKQEHRILQTTQELERRLGQMRSALDISFAIGRDLTLDQLLRKVVNLIRERFNYYFVGVYLLDGQNEFAVLKAGTGEAGEAMMDAGHRLAVNEASVVGWSIQHQQAKVAVDVGFEAVHFNNPLLSLTRSELILPLIMNKGNDTLPSSGYKSLDMGGNRVLGAITIQSTEAKAFSQEDTLILQEIANALATAIANTNLILQLEKNLDESQKLHRQYIQEAWKEVARESENYEYSYGSRRNSPADSSQEKAGSEYSFPLKFRDQEIGQLIIELDNPELKDEEKTFIEAVTNQAAVALENARLIEKNQRQASYERLLSDVSRKVNSSTDLDTILQITLREIGQVMKASDGIIQLKIPTGEEEAQL
jgi:GAF domain-containing protein